MLKVLGGTLLFWVATFDKIELMQYLLIQENINVNSTDDLGRTPLMAAAKEGRLEAIKVLLKREDVDIDHQDYLQ
jgi:ankyrin repeat protein